MIRMILFRHLILFLMSLSLIQCVQKQRAPASISIVSENMNYEICSTQNGSDSKNYLEKQILEKVDPIYLQNHEEDWERKIPIKCIRFAQKNFIGRYARCQSEYDKPEKTIIRPCLTENYTTLVYNAYHDVKNCFNLDPRSSFLQIMTESGFHINAIAQNDFDAGISQFTKNGILRVLDKSLMQKTREQLLTTSSASCQRISNIFDDLQKESAGIDQRCSMLAVPQNPYRALVMHYLHTLKDQIYFKNEFLSKRPAITAAVDQEIIEQFVYMAYNRGISGTLKLIDGYIESRRKVGHEIIKADLNLMQNLSAAYDILKKEPEKRALLKKRKVKNLSFAEYAMIYDQTYLLTMAKARDFVKSKLGEECF